MSLEDYLVHTKPDIHSGKYNRTLKATEQPSEKKVWRTYKEVIAQLNKIFHKTKT